MRNNSHKNTRTSLSLIALVCMLFVLLCSSIAFGQNNTVHGTVTDASSGETLPGVNILVKSTTTGTSANKDGRYELRVQSLQDTLVFTYVGYERTEIPINGRTTLNVKMSQQALTGEETVVVGYGTQRKRDVTGSISSITSDDFNTGVTLAPEQLMQGKVAGVNIVQSSGKPGASSAVHVRGTTSISAGNSPLYVIDGVPIQTASSNSYVNVSGESTTSPFNSMSSNPLNILNPADIQSIDVLKDASAEAIYGSRGANGVIIITTKNYSGTTVEYDGYTSVSKIRKTLPFLSASEYLNYAKGNNLQYPDLGATTNWQDEIFRTAMAQNHNISLGGSSGSTNYRASLGYMGQEGVIIGSNLNKYTGRINVRHSAVDDKLKINFNLTAAKVDQNQTPISANVNNEGGNILKDALRWAPTLPVKNDDGSYYQIGALRVNPVSWTQLSDQVGRNTVLGSAKFDYDITNWLTASVNLGYNNEFLNRNNYVPISNPVGANESGRAAINKVQNESNLIETNLHFNKDVTKDSHLDLLAGYSYQRFVVQTTFTSAHQFPSDATKWDLIQSGTILSNTSGKSANRLASFYGRVNYRLRDRYLLTLTLRDDGSSRFGENNRWGLFPSGALAWVISDEPFFPNSTVNNFKLRLGYGVTGNQEIPNDLYLEQLSVAGSSTYELGGTPLPSVLPSNYANPDLKWERTSQTNFGLDFGLFDNRLTGSVDYYIKKTSDLLLQFSTAAPSAVNTQWANVGKVENKGIEFSLDGVLVRNKNMQWKASANISANRNKVVTLSNDQFSRDYIQTGTATGVITYQSSNTQIIKPGLPLDTFWGYKYTGLDSEGMETYKKDANGNYVIEPIGNPWPDFTYGLSSSLKWNRFDVSVGFRGVVGNDIYNATAAEFSYSNILPGENALKTAINSGVSRNQTATYSSRWIQDGSYLRLDNVTVGYAFNTEPLPYVSRARVYLTGQNLFVITNYTGFDPEVQTNSNRGGSAPVGIDYMSYPRPRMFQLGVSLTF